MHRKKLELENLFCKTMTIIEDFLFTETKDQSRKSSCVPVICDKKPSAKKSLQRKRILLWNKDRRTYEEFANVRKFVLVCRIIKDILLPFQIPQREVEMSSVSNLSKLKNFYLLIAIKIIHPEIYTSMSLNPYYRFPLYMRS